MTTRRSIIWLLAGWACLVACLPASAGERVALMGPEWRPVDPASLDAQRGGYVLPSGLRVSFGFQRTVHVNGELVSALRVHVADVGRITSEEAAQLEQIGRMQLVQLGEGNAVHAQAAGLVIQNSLDGQHIQVQTTLDASTSTLGMLQALNVADALQAATIRSVGGL
ncbi:MAG TPA: hypothetical protein PLD19_04675 [Luteimonas sp.]|nr:hypothetical protein [Luteimonas sp.]